MRKTATVIKTLASVCKEFLNMYMWDAIVAVIEEFLENTSGETEYRLDVPGHLREQMLKSTNVAQETF
jgi:hypothetical protein